MKQYKLKRLSKKETVDCNEKLVRIEAPYFVAGFVYNEECGIIIRNAPIINWLCKKGLKRVWEILIARKWKFAIIERKCND